jgi:hypothetical protein
LSPEKSTVPTSHLPFNKLLEVDAGLAAQELELVAELESIREKRRGLEFVLGLFGEREPRAPRTVSKSAEGLEAVLEVMGKRLPTTDSEIDADAPQKSQKGKTAPTPSKKNASGPKTKKPQPVPSWRAYIHKKFKKMSLAESILAAMAEESDRTWTMAEILEAIFGKELPQDLRSKLRPQVSSILSRGVKSEMFSRTDKGAYRLIS